MLLFFLSLMKPSLEVGEMRRSFRLRYCVKQCEVLDVVALSLMKLSLEKGKSYELKLDFGFRSYVKQCEVLVAVLSFVVKAFVSSRRNL